MITSIYKNAFAVVMKKPFRLWGIILLGNLLTFIFSILFGGVLGIALAINLAISTSMTMIFLFGYRGKTPECADLFACLKDANTAKRVIGGMAWMTLWVFIWGLIPLVGWIFAIIKSYSYRLTPYILTLEPDVKITDAIKVSEQRTAGYKGKMFCADFLAYIAIAAVCFVLMLFARLLEPIYGFFVFLTVVVIIAAAFLMPLFIGLVQAAFYEEIMADKAAKADDEAEAAEPAAEPASDPTPEADAAATDATENSDSPAEE